MHIIRSNEPILVEHPVFTIFGQPGICKSSLSFSANNPLLLDFDGGVHRAANRGDTAAIQTWGDLVGLRETLAPYATVVVDTVGRCLDVMTLDIIDESPKYGKDGALTLPGYGVLKSRFRAWITALRAMGKDIVLIAHHKEDQDGDRVIVRPDIIGASYDEVMKISDFVGYLYMSGKDRVLDFNPTDRWVGKNPANWKPLRVPPIDKAHTLIAELINQGRKALGVISAASAGVATQVQDWRNAVEAYTTPEEINRAIEEIKALPPIATVQVKKILADRAKVLKFEWSGDSKYVQPQQVTA